MFLNYNEYEYYIRPGYTDMRYGANKLMLFVQEVLKEDPFAKTMFVFCGKGRKNLKVLVWDRNGFWLMQKKLIEGIYAWPMAGEEARILTPAYMKRLLAGEDVFRKIPEIEGGIVI